jgi:hypothetical protein
MKKAMMAEPTRSQEKAYRSVCCRNVLKCKGIASGTVYGNVCHDDREPYE